MASLHEKDDVSTNLESADRIPIYRDTLAEWQLLSLEQLQSPFCSGFPSYGTIRIIGRWSDFDVLGDGLIGFSPGGTGGAVTTNVASGRVGIITATTSTSSTGSYYVASGWDQFHCGQGRFRVRWDANIPTASDGSETFTVRIGTGDSGSGEHTDGLYFRYTHSVNSGNWVCVTRSNNVETTTNTSTSAAGTASYQTLEIEANAAGTSVLFYINGTLVATHTATIPTGTTRSFGIMAHIVKSVGTTSRSLNLDLCRWTFEPTTPL